MSKHVTYLCDYAASKKKHEATMEVSVQMKPSTRPDTVAKVNEKHCCVGHVDKLVKDSVQAALVNANLSEWADQANGKVPAFVPSDWQYAGTVAEFISAS